MEAWYWLTSSVFVACFVCWAAAVWDVWRWLQSQVLTEPPLLPMWVFSGLMVVMSEVLKAITLSL